MQNLVIVESPTKARTLQRYLGSKYQIEASMGHVRDLPKSDLGVDIEHDFEPQYVIPRDKRKRVNQLKKEAQGVQTLWLATDPDREGEAIAWHIAELLRNSKLKTQNSKVKSKEEEIKRVVFHEITEEAIKQAFEHPRHIDLKLVDAQQARRVLDRLVGYKLSPLLWQKVKRGLSAGRVQSVALRLVVEREREISAFKAQEYWIIEAELSTHLRGETGISSSAHLGGEVQESKFLATLIEQNGKKLTIKNKKEADGHLANLEKAEYSVSEITKKQVKRYPYPPFTTSTMQQAASNRLGFTAKKTMMLSQALYEHGLISYMRTDSVNLAPSALAQAREYISQNMGKNYLPASPRVYKSRSKNVQEAHEAIRPTNIGTQGSTLRGWQGMNKDHVRLYDLIWKRFVACQMSEVLMDQTTVDVIARTPSLPAVSLSNLSRGTKQSNSEGDSSSTSSPQDDNGILDNEVIASSAYLLRSVGSIVKFEGWLKLYGKEAEEAGEGKVLPELALNDPLKLIQLLPGQHFTEPPPRYTEASLIKRLEELGVGRPSTYAPILSTIQERFYVERVERKFIPTALGFAVTDFLVKYFPNIVDYSFTAQMEDELDEISRGERQWRSTIKTFYTPFEKKLEETGIKAEKVKMAVELAGKKCPECGKELVVRTGRFGKFLACSGFPDCKHTEGLEETINAICPQDGGEIVIRHTRHGKTFYGCKNWPGCKFASWTKPKTANPDAVIASPTGAKQYSS